MFYWLVIFSISISYVSIDVQSASLESFDPAKHLAYGDAGDAIYICFHIPKVVADPAEKPVENSKSTRRSLSDNGRRNSDADSNDPSMTSKSLKRYRGKVPRYHSILSSLPLVPGIPVIPGIGKLKVPKYSKKGYSSLPDLQKLIPQKVLSGEKPVSWTYNDGNTTININYNPNSPRNARNHLPDDIIESSKDEDKNGDVISEEKNEES